MAGDARIRRDAASSEQRKRSGVVAPLGTVVAVGSLIISATLLIMLATAGHETSHCAEGSPLAQFTGCKPGIDRPIIDPRP